MRSKHRAFLYKNRHLYEDLLMYQEGGCAICGRPPGERKLDMDHDHKTMELRGLLCTTCNRRLTGRITIKWLRDAADYLERPPADYVINVLPDLRGDTHE